jgi:hypothetical protein
MYAWNDPPNEDIVLDPALQEECLRLARLVRRFGEVPPRRRSENLRELVEQAAAYSGAADEDLMSQRTPNRKRCSSA